MSVSDTHPVRSGARAPFRPNGTISGLCLPGLFLLLTILAPAGLLGQTGAADLIIELEISRPDLERAVSELEGSGDGAADRDRNRRLIELGRTRLERGDFRSGDHVELRVEG